MPKRIDKILLADIINNIEFILAFTKDFSFLSFKGDLKTQYAADRCFEIIGEAARNLSEDFVLNNPGIE